MFTQRHHLLLSLKEHVLMMFLIQDSHIAFVAIAMKIKIVIWAPVVFAAGEKKNILSV